MISYENFLKNCEIVENRIEKICEKFGRSRGEIKILPVTKNHPVEAPIYAAIKAFITVAQNGDQEAAEKISKYFGNENHRGNDDFGVPERFGFELIGHLQKNKARKAAEIFSRIQSVDSPSLAEKLSKICEEISRERLPIFLQANPGSDPAKFGTADFDSLRNLAETAFAQKFLEVEGLMCVAPIDDDSLETARKAFETLRIWRDKLEREFGKKLPELSMGMSHDLEAAVAAGTTILRIGTALFGERNYAS